MGDAPYQPPEDYARFERLIEAVNGEQPDLVLHVGDIKSGSSACSDAVFERIRSYFATIRAPLIYTPGDNEWTDCHRAGMDPIERLGALRRLFFAEPRSLGQDPLPLVRQSDGPGARPYPENLRVAIGDVMVVAAHVVGSNNNLRRGNAEALDEYRARNEATAAWIRAGFEAAGAAGSRALVLAFHADPFTHGNGLPAVTNRSGFAATLEALADGAARFGRPVLVIHGDSHRYRFDQPFRDGSARPLANVTRLEVFGAPTVGAVTVTVVPGLDAPFAVEPFTAPEIESGADRR